MSISSSSRYNSHINTISSSVQVLDNTVSKILNILNSVKLDDYLNILVKQVEINRSNHRKIKDLQSITNINTSFIYKLKSSDFEKIDKTTRDKLEKLTLFATKTFIKEKNKN